MTMEGSISTIEPSAKSRIWTVPSSAIGNTMQCSPRNSRVAAARAASKIVVGVNAEAILRPESSTVSNRSASERLPDSRAALRVLSEPMASRAAKIVWASLAQVSASRQPASLADSGHGHQCLRFLMPLS